MNRCVLFLTLAAGCSNAAPPVPLQFELAGHLEDRRIREASGLARSHSAQDLLWVINDRGSKERVHAIRSDGQRVGEFELQKAKNKDWEDLASFVFDDTATLMIADIGDNDAKREHRTLYFVTEPVPSLDGKASISWEIEYRYPDGPRDAESAAIDTERGEVLILSKRDVPAILYAVPIDEPSNDGPTIAKRLGAIASLPQPSRQDVELAPKLKDWYWQPVGMDISDDQRAAVILTYRAIFYYQRSAEQSWLEALNSQPQRISIGNLANAEAVAFADADRTVIVTGENRNSPIIRIDLSGESQK